jgi:NAD-dependent dihydropyrimidine dehydrogenase PreA subunit
VAIKAEKHDIDKVIAIDHAVCRRCGACAKKCTTHLLEKLNKEDYPAPRAARVTRQWQEESVYKYDAPTCANCRICVITCPREAIDVIATSAKMDTVYNWGDIAPEVIPET